MHSANVAQARRRRPQNIAIAKLQIHRGRPSSISTSPVMITFVQSAGVTFVHGSHSTQTFPINESDSLEGCHDRSTISNNNKDQQTFSIFEKL